jgi:hypothetical protein
MREYWIRRAGDGGVVTDDGTVAAELQRLGNGTYTLDVDYFDEDEDEDEVVVVTAIPDWNREYTIRRAGHGGVVTDDGTVAAELQRLGRGTYTLDVDSFDG